MVAVAELFARTGSPVSAVTAAASEIVPFLITGRIVTVTLAVAPLASVPREQVTVPAEPVGGAVQLPWLAVLLTNWLAGGKVSVTTTPCESDGPRLCTVTANVTGLE